MSSGDPTALFHTRQIINSQTIGLYSVSFGFTFMQFTPEKDKNEQWKP